MTAKHRNGTTQRGAAAALIACGVLVGCTGPSTPVQPRYVAIHNALAALGMVEIGPIRQGTLGQGMEAHVPLGVVSGCATVVVVGGDGVRDIDAALVDAVGHSQAHDTTSEPQAVLSVCPESPQSLDLLVRVAAGSGPWISAIFQGGGVPQRADSAPRAASQVERPGTCDAPIPLGEGTVTGSTVHGGHEQEGSCAPSDAREIVYRLDVATRASVTLDLESHFDAVLYVRRGECADSDTEMACDDDSPDQTHSHISQVFEPGTYFVFVDGYTREGGTFKLTVTMGDALSRLDACGQSRLLVPGQSASGSTAGLSDAAHATCAGGAEGPDAAWRLEVRSRSRVRIAEHAVDDFAPVLHVRRACAEEASEVRCSDSGIASGDATVTGVFDPGTYFVFADARDKAGAGQYVLEPEMVSFDGDGTVSNEACGNPTILRHSPISGDTFFARDDFAASCGGGGAPDVAYRVDVARRSRLVASLRADESDHVLAVSTRCGDRATELACGAAIDTVLVPGSYFVTVDGAREESFGRFAFAWHLQDLTQQAGACSQAPELVQGRAFTATTVGGGNRFSTSCGGSGSGETGPDRVYRVGVASRTRVRLALRAQGFDAILSLRTSCTDGQASLRENEVACVSSTPEKAGRVATIDRILEPGTYWVLVDGRGPDDAGPISLRLDEGP